MGEKGEGGDTKKMDKGKMGIEGKGAREGELSTFSFPRGRFCETKTFRNNFARGGGRRRRRRRRRGGGGGRPLPLPPLLFFLVSCYARKDRGQGREEKRERVKRKFAARAGCALQMGFIKCVRHFPSYIV